MAVDIEVGFPEYPLIVSYLGKKKKMEKEKSTPKAPILPIETLPERTRRQAAERKRLIEDLMNEDLLVGDVPIEVTNGV